MDSLINERELLVNSLINKGYLRSKNVIQAMLDLPRELFVPPGKENQAYVDSPMGTYQGQTISAPHMNAVMCESLDLQPGHKVLEIGTGSGYHAGLCAKLIENKNNSNLSGHVYTVERIKKLAEFARENVSRANLKNLISIIHGDGTLGYKEGAPFDRILVTAAGPKIPEPLVDQLKIGGKLCIPVGGSKLSQKLLLLTKTEKGIKSDTICGVIFVPLKGKHGF